METSHTAAFQSTLQVIKMASVNEISALRQELARHFGQLAEQRSVLAAQLEGLRDEVSAAAASAAASAAAASVAAASAAMPPSSFSAAAGLDLASVSAQLAEYGASARVQLWVTAAGLLASSVGSPALAVALLALGYRRGRAASMFGAVLAALVAHPSTTIAAGVLFCSWRAGLGVRNVGRRVVACFRRSAPPPTDVELGAGAGVPAENEGGQGGWLQYATSFLPGRGPQPT